jgi:hypothetical protein
MGKFLQAADYSSKEIVLAANERIVGVTGREPNCNDLQFMIARLK